MHRGMDGRSYWNWNGTAVLDLEGGHIAALRIEGCYRRGAFEDSRAVSALGDASERTPVKVLEQQKGKTAVKARCSFGSCSFLSWAHNQSEKTQMGGLKGDWRRAAGHCVM